MRLAGLIVILAASMSAGGAAFQSFQTPTPPQARPTSVGTSVDDFMTSQYPYLRRVTLAAVEKMPDDAMSLKPNEGARTFAETVVHLGVSNFAMCRSAAGSPVPPDQIATLRKLSTKAELMKLMNDGFAACDPVFATPGDDRAASTRAMLTVHSWQVYGTMAVYLRLKGIVPPTTEEALKARRGGPGRW